MENPIVPDLILTCEHASNEVPEKFSGLFEGHSEILNSHRGWDPGAYNFAENLSNKLKAPLITFPYSRLLIEPNRSARHPTLFSEFSKPLPKHQKEWLMRDLYLPYRHRVADEIRKKINQNRTVLHLGIHSFTPELQGTKREFELGLLYDPKRSAEKQFAILVRKKIMETTSKIRVRMNRPYKGISDGFTTSLRKQFPETDYLGIEIEWNQQFLMENSDEAVRVFSNSVQQAVSAFYVTDQK